MGLAMYKLTSQQKESPPRKPDLPQVRILHKPPRPQEQFIKNDAIRATDLLIGLRIYLQTRTSN